MNQRGPNGFSRLMKLAWTLTIMIVLHSNRAISESPTTLDLKTLPPDLSFNALFEPQLDYPYFEHANDLPFRPGKTQFDLINAWWLAEASMLAYVTDANFVADQFGRAGLPQLRTFRSSDVSSLDTEGFIAHNDQFVIVAMRGTEPDELKDFLTDLNLLQKKARDGGRVHLGFRAGLDEVWNEMSAHLNLLASDGRTIWFTGHSLGAALAVLAANRYGKAAGVYTYGCPRVGNAEFAERYDQPTFRVVNNLDVVTELPPPLMYRHVGTLKHFGNDERLLTQMNDYQVLQDRIRGQMEAATNRLRQLTELRYDRTPPKTLADHAPIHYVVNCWNQLVESHR